MKRFYILMLAIFALNGANAQITTSGINGVVTDMAGQPLVGATVIAVHTPSGSQYGAVANATGRYSIQGMRTGGPYTVTLSFVGYQSNEFTDITLQLGETLTRNAQLKDTQELDAVVISADGKNSPMNINRAGASTSVSKEQIELMPTVSRSMNDIMRLTPQASSTTSGMALGGGNYRQSYVTVDGAAFNNAFGIGGNLPSGGSPISLDALEQISIAITPFDVRQSGFTGGAINAVTKGGTNQLKVSAYNYYKSDKLQGNRIADGGEVNKYDMFNNTFGFNIGTPIVKDKLFFFTNFEYEWNTNPAQRRKARATGTDTDYVDDDNFNRPTVGKMEEIKSFLKDKLGYDPGRYQNYETNTPGWKLMTRLDWNINKNHSMNVRFSTTRTSYSSAPSSSISPLTGYDKDNNGRLSKTGLYFESARYYQQQNFTSVAAELNSRFADGALNNILRATYSRQHEPRSFEGNLFPTVDILEPLADGKTNALYTTFGLDPFTYGNLRDVSTYVVTDEISFSRGIHNLIGGAQFEHNHTVNGYMQGGAGYYMFSSWDSFKKAVDPNATVPAGVDGTPMAFAITHANRTDLKQTFPSFNFMQFSVYFQDEMNISDRLKATIGIRFEIPTYPSLKSNENAEFTKLFAGNGGYKTSDMPKATINVSPRFGFNWDMTGERKYILRGGTGVFTGRLPFVWVVSAVGNSNCDQAQTILYAKDGADKMPGFSPNISDMLNDIYGGKFEQKALPAPQSPTIMDKNLKMPSTWKTSLAFDLKLPAGIDLNLEGIYNKDVNAVAVTKLGQIEKVGGMQLPGEPRARKAWMSQGIKNSAGRNVNPYLISNSDIAGYYYSFTGQAQKRFRNGISLMAAYTYSQSKSVIDGIGDQVTSAYNTNTFCVDGSNTPELGYSSYVTPHRILASVSYRKEYGNNFGTSVALFYEGARQGYIGNYSYARYSYTCYTQSGKYLDPVVGDGGAQNLIYVPTDAELKDMPFETDKNRNEYQNFINGDKYLSSIKGQYSQRGGAVMPWFHSVNFKFAQDFFVNVRGKRNTITVGIDINNVANLLNRNWGNIKQLSTNSILSYSKNDAGAMQYKFIEPKWRAHTNLISTWSALFSVRYTFN